MLSVAPRMQTSMYVYACLSNKYIGPVWWSFCSGSCPRHVSLGAGNQPPVAVERLLLPWQRSRSCFAVHAGATKTNYVAPAPTS